MPILLVVIWMISSCQMPDPSHDISEEFNYFLHISHTRGEDNSHLNPLVDSLNLQNSDLLLLGGDLAYHTSVDSNTMQLVNEKLHISDPGTLWSIGNHDDTNPDLLRSYTHRPTFYSYYKNDIVFIILDTEKDSCFIKDKQLALVKKVADTIESAKHLILIHHKMIWMPDHSELKTQIKEVSNGGMGMLDYQLRPNNFYTDVYPELNTVKEKGINVICIAGDVGLKTGSFEYETKEGIHFLASGLSSEPNRSRAIVFKQNKGSRQLEWTFIRPEKFSDPFGMLINQSSPK